MTFYHPGPLVRRGFFIGVNGYFVPRTCFLEKGIVSCWFIKNFSIMNNFKLGTGPGDRFQDIAERAKSIAEQRSLTVEFDFNDITCLVDSTTHLEWLWRDYQNAHMMEWKTVGPDCQGDYSPDTQIELYTKKLAAAKERKRQEEEWDSQDKKERRELEERVSGIELSIIPEKISEYAEYVEKNSQDGYSRGVVDYAEAWAKTMQKVMAETGKSVREVAEESQKGLGFLGITGFMYGACVSTLSHFWIHGEDLRKWHNKEYGISEDKKGVANPAVFTIG